MSERLPLISPAHNEAEHIAAVVEGVLRRTGRLVSTRRTIG